MRCLVVVALVAAAVAAPAAAQPPHGFHVIASWPAWSPDFENAIAYTQQLPGFPPRAELVVASRDGSRPSVLAPDGYAARWSPVGELVAFLAPENASGNVTELRIGTTALLQNYPLLVADGVANFAWSRRGDELYYDEGWKTCGRIHAVATYDVSQRRAVVAGANPLPSPDGTKLAYFTSRPPNCTGGFGSVSAANADGTDAHIVVPRAAVRAAWAPDGRRLAVELLGEREPIIATVGVDGTGFTEVAHGTHPAWSPDGRELAFLSVPDAGAPFPRDEPFLRILDVATGRIGPRLLSASAENGGPAWSPDGAMIALSRALERGGHDEGVAAGLNRFVSLYTVPVDAPAHAHRISPAACELLKPRCTDAGGPGGNVVNGTRRRDVIWGYGGDDRIAGGAGDDDLHGGSGADTLAGGAGSDTISGGSGGDVVLTRDGMRDAIYCGSGYDVVVADRVDAVARDCERVSRG